MFNKLKLILMTPIILLGFIIDVLFGDMATGVKTTGKQKAKEHIDLFKIEWCK